MVHIDGSILEGGGAILRMATALSAITAQAVHIYNIRARRRNPGLRAQHLESLKTAASLCSGRLVNAFLGSTEIELHPGKIVSGSLSVEMSTAGSVGLLFQSICTPMCIAEGDVTLTINGGATFAKWAPPLLSITNVLLPILKSMDYHAEIEILRHGFFPRGGARVRMNGHPCQKLRPLVLTDQGKISLVKGISIASNHLQKARVAERQAAAAQEELLKNGLPSEIRFESVDSACPGSGIVLWGESSSGAIIGTDSIGERGKPSETIGKEAALELLQTIQSGAALDEHLSDQVLIFMALAEGESAITTTKLTNHAKTNIHVINEFLPALFRVYEVKNALIQCSNSRPIPPR